MVNPFCIKGEAAMAYYIVQLILGLINFLFSNWLALVIVVAAIGVCTIMSAGANDWKQKMAGIVILLFIAIVAISIILW